MKNDESEAPTLSEPELFRRRFGAKARDPAVVIDKMHQAEHAHVDRVVDDIETFGRLDSIWLIGPAIYLMNLPPLSAVVSRIFPNLTVPDPTIPAFALAFWALATVFWTPWILLRVDRRQPPGDTARAAAILGYGLLGWPLAIVPTAAAGALFRTDLDGALNVAFPFVFLWGASAMGLASRATSSPPSPRRAAFLAGGGAAYLGWAIADVAFILGPLTAWMAEDENKGFVAFVMIVVAILALMWAVAALRLLRAALDAWRKRHLTAAAP